jgi:hypothetical protein
MSALATPTSETTLSDFHQRFRETDVRRLPACE